MTKEEIKMVSEAIVDNISKGYYELKCPNCGMMSGYIEEDAEDTCCKHCDTLFRIDKVIKFETIEDIKFFIWYAIQKLLNIDPDLGYWGDC